MGRSQELDHDNVEAEISTDLIGGIEPRMGIHKIQQEELDYDSDGSGISKQWGPNGDFSEDDGVPVPTRIPEDLIEEGIPTQLQDDLVAIMEEFRRLDVGGTGYIIVQSGGYAQRNRWVERAEPAGHGGFSGYRCATLELGGLKENRLVEAAPFMCIVRNSQ
ncbi:hypothetical protein OSB04_004042 [Centaurea solstitialis]|uniref:Uncharacterized protein n=1 Tax=Centaurea solstitialis TaxID=347529 RepID=A0AA38U6H8_9ASTR|nr:hypothetical protein OSB04_004042 [Centaurea solstitialis]